MHPVAPFDMEEQIKLGHGSREVLSQAVVITLVCVKSVSKKRDRC